MRKFPHSCLTQHWKYNLMSIGFCTLSNKRSFIEESPSWFNGLHDKVENLIYYQNWYLTNFRSLCLFTYILSLFPWVNSHNFVYHLKGVVLLKLRDFTNVTRFYFLSSKFKIFKILCAHEIINVEDWELIHFTNHL